MKEMKNKNRKEPPLWEDRELERRHSERIDEILKECESLPEHAKIMTLLKKTGSLVLEPQVRRDPKEEGAASSEGRGEKPSWMERAEESPFRKVQGLILNAMPAGTHIIFMKTRKGAGLTVATAIDESNWEELAGIAPGPSSVVLLTENQSCQALLMYRLKYFADRYGGERAEGEVKRLPLYG